MNVDNLELILESEKNRQALIALTEGIESGELEEGFKDVLHVALDVIGLIPLVGEPADLVNGILYLTSKPPEYLFAAFSFISIIPEIGDAIGKGGKIAVWAAKAAKRMPKTSKAAGKATKTLTKLQDKLHDNQAAVQTVMGELEKRFAENEKTAALAPHVQKMQQALEAFSGKRSAVRRARARSAGGVSVPNEFEVAAV